MFDGGWLCVRTGVVRGNDPPDQREERDLGQNNKDKFDAQPT